MNDFNFTAFTDGSCLRNPGGPGGWAYRLTDNRLRHTVEGSGGCPETTNNRMELIAAIQALTQVPEGASVCMYVDSQYVKSAFTEGWLANWKRRAWVTAAGRPVANRDLWERLDALVAARTVTWVWTRGHVGQPDNEYVDTLARRAAEEVRSRGHG